VVLSNIKHWWITNHKCVEVLILIISLYLLFTLGEPIPVSNKPNFKFCNEYRNDECCLYTNLWSVIFLWQNKKQVKQDVTSQFRSQVDALGLRIVEVTADGNCFFRSALMLQIHLQSLLLSCLVEYYSSANSYVPLHIRYLHLHKSYQPHLINHYQLLI